MDLRPDSVRTSSPICSSCTRRSPDGVEIFAPFNRQFGRAVVVGPAEAEFLANATKGMLAAPAAITLNNCRRVAIGQSLFIALSSAKETLASSPESSRYLVCPLVNPVDFFGAAQNLRKQSPLPTAFHTYGCAPIAPQAAGGEAADDRRPRGGQLCTRRPPADCSSTLPHEAGRWHVSGRSSTRGTTHTG